MDRAIHEERIGPSTEELRLALEASLSQQRRYPVRVERLRRLASPYRTSFALEELSVQLDDGSQLELMFKDVGWAALHDLAIQAKPRMLYDPLREIETYRTILTPQGVSAPAFHGARTDAKSEQYWLFVERVEGWTLFEVEAALWPPAARYLAAMHAHFASDHALTDRAVQAHLILYDAPYYRQWAERAGGYIDRTALPVDKARAMDRLLQRYGEVIERLVALPRTFLHGEFFASNVLVQGEGEQSRICPIDWEMAAIGPGLVDLAALTSGNWTEAQRRALAMEYYHALPEDGWKPELAEFFTNLTACHLHIAMQWLGWSPRWTPPPEHTWNWLDEALRLAKALDLL